MSIIHGCSPQLLGGHSNNMAWGAFSIVDQTLNLADRTGETDGGALYVGEVPGAVIGTGDVLNIYGTNGLNIYSLASLAANDYLGGLNYALATLH